MLNNPTAETQARAGKPARPEEGPGSPLPSISLPRGGGAVRGIDEKFAVNAATGTASLRVPLAVTAGRSGFGPELALSYDSGAGNGPFGLGWSLGVAAVTRKTDRGLPRYRDEADPDTFVLAGAEDLVPARVERDGEWVPDVVETADAVVRRYRPRTEGAFARIERWTDRATGSVHWRTVDRDNVTSIFGRSAGARIADPGDGGRVFSWLLEERADDRGNVVVFEYKAEDAAGVDPAAPHERHRLASPAFANRYLKRVLYGNRLPFEKGDWCFEVVLDYGEHDEDAPSPAEVRPWPARDDAFSSYRAGFEVRTYRLCRRVLTFHRFPELGPEPVPVRSTELAYDDSPETRHALRHLASVTERGWLRGADGAYTTEALPPVRFGYTPRALDGEVRALAEEALDGLPEGVDGARYQWVDLDGEGIPGVLSEQGGEWHYKPNLGGGALAPPRVVARRPSPASLADGRQQVMDLRGDGRSYVVSFRDPLPGFHAREADGEWSAFTPFRALPRLDWSDPNLRMLDLDGDGHAEAVISGEEVFTWYPSKAADGFGPAERTAKADDEERGPALVFADAEQSVYLADMGGDGLTDIVRIRNGEVCYWPNLGFGRFGARVAMEGAPVFDAPELFSQRRVRLADVDGSGTTDLVYLGREGLTVWFNQAGNRWSAPLRVPGFPALDDLSSVAVADLLGTGTACVVWSSSSPRDAERPLRYLDLLGGRKPFLLERVANGMGREVRLEYAPSTRFYLEARAEGRPWITRLPFPVHVVARVEEREGVTGTTRVTRYRYAHGYYDGEEREFRGFALVEQWDAESFAADGDLPPVLTRTWYHTGAWLDRATVARACAAEYWAGDPLAAPLADTVLPPGLSAREEREAYRALRGRVLRQEVFAEDGSPLAAHPYTVAEHAFDLHPVQPAAGDGHAVFHVRERESLHFHYERDPADPRVSHALTLEVDAWGNVLRTAATAYPRRAADAHPEQAGVLVTLAEHSVSNHPDEDGWYRLGVPLETRSWEVTGLAPAAGGRFTVAGMLAALEGAEELPYEAEPAPGAVRKRLIEHVRTVYQSDLGPLALPFGEVPSRARVHQTFTLALTPGLVAAAYGSRVAYNLLEWEAGYVAWDGGWWIPSGWSIPHYGAFLLPVAHVDVFGGWSMVEWDAHGLAPVRAEDSLGNVTEARIHYRVLRPWWTVDPNGNRTGARFDALGRVVASAAMGKAGTGEGDALDEDTPEASPADDPTTRAEYDLGRWEASGLPARVRTLARERHGDPDTPWQESYLYVDGLGREVMRKVQAEPGDLSPEPRWLGTGRTVWDNKGNPVRKYEPFFSSTPEYEDEAEVVEWGVTAVLRYDPLGRLVRTDYPDGTLSRVELGAWRQESWDQNDTVLQSTWYADRASLPDTPENAAERRAAQLAAAHAATPAVSHLDVLGRPFLGVADNGPAGTYQTRTTLDVEGNRLRVVDARGHLVAENLFDVSGAAIRRWSPDAGERRTLNDVAGNPLRVWDGRGNQVRTGYDSQRRPTGLWVSEGGGPERLAQLTVYGEAHPEAARRNLRGRAYRQFDGAGTAASEEFDFKGNPLRESRTFALAHAGEPDWSPLAALTGVEEIEAAAAPLLAGETFSTARGYDALDRPAALFLPDSSEVRPVYNAANLLEAVDVRPRGGDAWTRFVEDIDYNARGEREAIRYGNGVRTEYTHDPLTFRTVALRSVRDTDGAALQELRYTYDAVGNLVEVRDAAQQTVFFDNAVVSSDARYVYDALYRLAEAEGREHAGAGADAPRDHSDFPLNPVPHANDASALRRYTERYAYDGTGNLLSMLHLAGGGVAWRRGYAYEEGSSRLARTSLPGDPEGGPYSAAYAHDAHGNLTRMPHLPDMQWSFKDQLREVDLGGGGRAFYAYDAAGSRVRKVVDRAGVRRERFYLGGFEVYREHDASGVRLERQTLHVMDDQRRVARVETLTRRDGAPVSTPVSRVVYTLDDHLRSSCVELDADGALLGYEEYYPFGGTSYRSGRASAEVGRKRYRYSGKERDEETGLYYYGARYYAPWLGRWTSADPLGMVNQTSLYVFASNNPVNRVDVAGLYDPAAFGDKLDKYIDRGEKAALAENTGLLSSVYNTGVATLATVARGSTSILRVGTGAAQGVEQIEKAQDGWDYAIGVLRIVADTGEVAGAALGTAGTVTKGSRMLGAARAEKGIDAMRTTRAARSQDLEDALAATTVDRNRVRTLRNEIRDLSEQIGDATLQKEAAASGLRDAGNVKLLSRDGTPRSQGLDAVFKSGDTFTDAAGKKPFGPKRTVVGEAKGSSRPPDNDPASILSEDTAGRVQGARDYNTNRLERARDTGNATAGDLLNRINNGSTHESFLVIADVNRGGVGKLYQLEGATGTPNASLVRGMGSEIPTVLGTAGMSVLGHELFQTK
ncbi:MAG TPA: SpvB/TcaC N-terminal domain-containing protein [Longimicrobiaceae bacterium]|nr:SpvB/TcaC N-terminal domain-containing protein [Longimicrobiaceae bacterium]